VIVGCGAEVERVAMVEGYLDIKAKRPEFEGLMLVVVEPESSIFTAADVVLAMNLADGGRGWLWFPS
jgi:hypothetical protein